MCKVGGVMGKTMSTNIDESVIAIINKIAKKENLSKKKIIEKAVFLFWDKINSSKDNNIFENSFGSWNREELIEDTVKESREAFNAGFNRHLKKE